MERVALALVQAGEARRNARARRPLETPLRPSRRDAMLTAATLGVRALVVLAEETSDPAAAHLATQVAAEARAALARGIEPDLDRVTADAVPDLEDSVDRALRRIYRGGAQ